MTVLSMRALATGAAVAALVLTAGACASEEQPAPARSISRTELQSQVAGMYPADTEETTVRVRCDGELAAAEGASQECRVKVDQQRAAVRVSVTDVVGTEVRIDSVLVVPAVRVARELLEALSSEGFDVDEVTCPGELLGRVDEQVTCTVTPNTGSGEVTATVTKIRGLRVDFDYAVA